MLVATSSGLGLIGLFTILFGSLFFAASISFIFFSTIRRKRRETQPITLQSLRLPLLTLGILIVVLSALKLDLSFRARFALSKPALQREAVAILAGSTLPTPRQIGLFSASEVEKGAGMVRFILGDAFLDDMGVVYSPKAAPTRIAEDTYSHITGDWWYWHRSW